MQTIGSRSSAPSIHYQYSDEVTCGVDMIILQHDLIGCIADECACGVQQLYFGEGLAWVKMAEAS